MTVFFALSTAQSVHAEDNLDNQIENNAATTATSSTSESSSATTTETSESAEISESADSTETTGSTVENETTTTTESEPSAPVATKETASLKTSPVGACQSYGKYMTFTSGNYSTYNNFSWNERQSTKNIAGKTYLAKGKY